MDARTEHHLQCIAHLLVQDNLLSKEKVYFYQNIAGKSGVSLLYYLVINHIICPTLIATSIAEHFGLPLIDLDCVDITSIPTKLISDKLIRCHRMVPIFHEGGQVSVATDDPSQHEALQELQFHTGLRVSAVLVESHKLTRLINSPYARLLAS